MESVKSSNVARTLEQARAELGASSPQRILANRQSSTWKKQIKAVRSGTASLDPHFVQTKRIQLWDLVVQLVSVPGANGRARSVPRTTVCSFESRPARPSHRRSVY
jgi:hypothetical protein